MRPVMLDWEGARIGPPLSDMLHLATTWHMMVHGATSARDELASIRALFLRRTDGSAVELAGPLAVPRIAGPGYKVWVLGRLARGALVVRRLGVLAPPSGANSGTMPSP